MLDSIDRKILNILSSQGRLSHFVLGDLVGRSPTSVARRQRGLEKAGMIAGYSAALDYPRLGYPIVVNVHIALKSQDQTALDAFEEAVALSPSVVRCDLMSGSDDYLVVVRARSLQDFTAIHREQLSRLPGIMRMESSFVLKEVVPTRALPGIFADPV